MKLLNINPFEFRASSNVLPFRRRRKISPGLVGAFVCFSPKDRGSVDFYRPLAALVGRRKISQLAARRQSKRPTVKVKTRSVRVADRSEGIGAMKEPKEDGE